MSRFNEIVKFIDFELMKNQVIEPVNRREIVKERIYKSIKTFNPDMIIKIGIGFGDLLLDIAQKTEYVLVVEPSRNAINVFLEKNKDNSLLKKINFINGEFNNLPVDYYVAKMVICVDYLDFIESGVAIDEIKRVLDFEGIFFFGGVVLNKSDIEGVYDDFVHLLDPLHNDYYLPGDFKTLMELKDFSTIHGGINTFPKNIDDIIKYWENYSSEAGQKQVNKEEVTSFIEENRKTFSDMYQLSTEMSYKENYLTAEFRKNRYSETPASLDK